MEIDSLIVAEKSNLDFQGRVDAVFGALGSTSWSLASTQVLRPGRDDLDSSEDDEDEDLKTREARVQLDDYPNEQLEKPSKEFCNALDREEEYDAYDAVATDSVVTLQPEDVLRACSDTEVLPDNVWEVRCVEQETRQALLDSRQVLPDNAWEVRCIEHETRQAQTVSELSNLPSTSGAALPPTLRSTSRSATRGILANSKSGNRVKKTVRFKGVPELPSPYVPPHRRPGHEITCKPSDGQQITALVSSGSEGLVARRGYGYVPDHVRNPHKYTCYVLEEPIVVGSGQDASTTERDNKKAALVAVADAQYQGRTAEDAGDVEDRHVAVFGSGIEFRPRNVRGQPQANNSGAMERGQGECKLSIMEEEAVEHDDASQVDGGAQEATAVTFRPTKHKERKLRTKHARNEA